MNMTATEVLQISIESCKDNIKEVYNQITEAAIKGKTSLILPSIKEGTVSQLINDGFEISSQEIKLSNTKKILSVEISWKNIL